MTTQSKVPSKYALALLPHEGLSPAACGAIAIALEEAADTLRTWNIRLPQTGRVALAAKHLQRIADQGHYGESDEELRLSAQAIFLANDFYAISRTLTADRQETIARELVRALGGKLGQDSLDRRPYEIQSQFWFGTLLAYSQLHPAVPDVQGKRPDFVVTVDEVRLGIEVKRPTTIATARALIDSADDQIRGYGQPGIVAIDLSDALGTQLLHNEVCRDQRYQRARDAVRPLFSESVDELKAYIRARQPRDFASLIGLVAYTRFCVWENPEADLLDFGFLLQGQVFPAACTGLMEHFAERMLDRLVPGIRRLTGNPFDQINSR